jgi:rod shape-determining protein MreB
LPAGLTPRELMVISLIGAGLSNKEISARLFVSDNTVKTYIRTGYRKIEVQSRVHAALWAMEHGLVALPVHEPAGNMIVDIGGGTTEVAVISLGGIVVSESSRVGGDEFDEAIINFVKREYSLALGERTAEEVKVQLASAWPLEEELYAEVRGRDLITGLPKTIVLSTVEIREAVEEPTASIVDSVKVTLDQTPPELAADIMERGIVITGGGSQLIGIENAIQAETGMPVHRAKHPLYSVVLGSGQCLENFDVLQQVLSSSPQD